MSLAAYSLPKVTLSLIILICIPSVFSWEGVVVMLGYILVAFLLFGNVFHLHGYLST